MQVAASILSMELQLQLHLAVVKDLEEQRSETPDSALSKELLQLLVYHWSRCDSEEAPGKSIHYLTLQGDRALLQTSIEEVSELVWTHSSVAVKGRVGRWVSHWASEGIASLRRARA